MPGPHPAVALTRRAVRTALASAFTPPAHRLRRPATPSRVVVGVSGGADSLVLAAALAFEAPRQDVGVEAVVVDHGLQEGSEAVAERAARTCRERLGLSTRVRRVDVPEAGAGLEAHARDARYAALRDVAGETGAQLLVLGHTGDDQAEQVLLGLLRGSGTRSLAGMRVRRDDVLRPFLLAPPLLDGGPVMREHTVAACAALGLEPWHDPHNADGRFTRVRVREALAVLETGLDAPTLRRSLIRTADSAARDADLLDRLTDEALARAAGTKDTRAWPRSWPVEVLASLDPALRIRAVRRLLLLAGALGSQLTAQHLLDVESLLVRWRGQGPVDVPGHLEAARTGGELAIRGRRETE